MEETEKDIGYRILTLERRLAAYQKVHAEELDELQQLLSELKDDVLASCNDEVGAGVETLPEDARVLTGWLGCASSQVGPSKRGGWLLGHGTRTDTLQQRLEGR